MFFFFDKRSFFLGEGEVNRGNYFKFVILLIRIFFDVSSSFFFILVYFLDRGRRVGFKDR